MFRMASAKEVTFVKATSSIFTRCRSVPVYAWGDATAAHSPKFMSFMNGRSNVSNVDRGCLLALVVFTTAIGGFILISPADFYTSVPGVAAAGPYDAHLIRDVGIAYMTLALGGVLALRHPANAPVVTALTATYFVGHAILHAVLEASSVRPLNAMVEAPGIYLPAIVSITLMVRFNRTPAEA